MPALVPYPGAMTALEPRISDAYTNDREHVFHSWSAQGALDPVVIAGALGAKFWDESGTEWIDFSSQLVNMNLGHQHPKMVQAIKDQADRLCMVAPSFANAVARPASDGSSAIASATP